MAEITITNLQEIRTGDTLLVDSGSWLAKMIKKFQRCRYNHAGMFVWIDEKLYICEADKYGICLTDFMDYIFKKNDLLCLRPKFKIEPEQVRNISLPKCGHAKYDKFNLVLHQVVRYITGKRVWIGRREPEADNKFICGEWVEYIYHKCTGGEYFKDWYKEAPEDIYNSEHFYHYHIDKKL